jgi:hypothetical protein
MIRKNLKAQLTLATSLVIASLILQTPVLSQGAFERSTPETRVLFEEGNYFELYWLAVSPDNNGSGGLLDPTGLGTGDVLNSYDQWAFSLKRDLTARTSVALILDQPWGVDVAYPIIPTSGYSGTSARINSNELSGVIKQKVGQRGSVYAGVRLQSIEASAAFPFGGLIGLGGPYAIDFDRDEGVGFMAGAAYEIPDLAFRLAATYYSEIETTHDTVEIAGTALANTRTELTTPQAINLEFQSGIAKNTLLFGSVRWVDWSKFAISPPLFSGTIGVPVVEYTEDYFTYTAGIGRKITDRFDLAFLMRYTPATDQIVPTAGPNDGNISYFIAPSIQLDRVKITTIIGYSDLHAARDFAGARFDDGDVFTVGVQLGYNF